VKRWRPSPEEGKRGRTEEISNFEEKKAQDLSVGKRSGGGDDRWQERDWFVDD